MGQVPAMPLRNIKLRQLKNHCKCVYDVLGYFVDSKKMRIGFLGIFVNAQVVNCDLGPFRAFLDDFSIKTIGEPQKGKSNKG